MSSALFALAPVFGMIVIGYGLKRRGFVTDAFWEPAEKLTFYILFPSLLVTKIGGAQTAGADLLPMAAALITATLIISGLVVMGRPGLHKAGLSGPGFTSVFQGAIRPTTFVGIPTAYALFGDTGLALFAAALLAVIPIANFFSLAVLIRWAKVHENGAQPGWGGVVGLALKNPIILACLAGGGLNLTGTGLPPVIGPILENLGAASLPLGLMAAGSGLDFNNVMKSKAFVFGTSFVKLLITPAVTYTACVTFGVDGTALSVAVLFMALPVAGASYVIARQLGGDGPLMAGIITASTIAAAVTLPVVIMLTVR